jgi:prepilin-type N-terminal cleavage/methylation domain-containing protein
MKKFKSGFTLAEVLITLGIIGVVAAIVMPSVMTNYTYKTVGVKLSKFVSQAAIVVS